MSEIWASGACRWLRDRALARATARLCVGALLLNLFAPILWAVAAPATGLDTPILCHDAGAATQPSQPGDPAKPSGQAVPHCPLCVLFGGTAWAPPAAAAVVLAAPPQRLAATATRGEAASVPLPHTLRPSPRGPPALI